LGESTSRRERIIDPTSQDNATSLNRLKHCRFTTRQCLRKGCENRYHPRQRNQRFCRDSFCQAEVKRWQAAKRQQKWRSDANNRIQQADRERLRREKLRLQAQASQLSAKADDVCDLTMADFEPVTLPPALSRNSSIPKDFCDRPGCYEPTRPSQRNPAKYCSNACRTAMQRVRDRDRKWRARSRSQLFSVLNYGRSPDPRLSFQHSHRSANYHAQADSGSRPRPPPTA
jgi:hypothetical protein